MYRSLRPYATPILAGLLLGLGFHSGKGKVLEEKTLMRKWIQHKHRHASSTSATHTLPVCCAIGDLDLHMINCFRMHINIQHTGE